MSDKKTPREFVQDKVRSEEQKDNIIQEVIEPKGHGQHVLSEMQTYDVKEVLAYGMVNNLRRRQCIDLAKEFLEQHEIVVGKDISEKRIIHIYQEVRNILFDRSMQNIEKEKDNFYKNMNRLALKCEAANDFGNAIKAYKEIAELNGVFSDKGDNKITINFVPAKKIEDK